VGSLKGSSPLLPGASNPAVGGAQPQPHSSVNSEVAGTLPPNFTLANTEVRSVFSRGDKIIARLGSILTAPMFRLEQADAKGEPHSGPLQVEFAQRIVPLGGPGSDSVGCYSHTRKSWPPPTRAGRLKSCQTSRQGRNGAQTFAKKKKAVCWINDVGGACAIP
jgi:hypothetical protein